MAKGTSNRIAAQPDGMPQGRHLTGFKGTKTADTASCLCGSCHPNAKAGKNYVRVIDPNKGKVSV